MVTYATGNLKEMAFVISAMVIITKVNESMAIGMVTVSKFGIMVIFMWGVGTMIRCTTLGNSPLSNKRPHFMASGLMDSDSEWGFKNERMAQLVKGSG